MARPSWAQVAMAKVKLTTPYKITYSRKEPNPVFRLQQVERQVRDLLRSLSLLEQENSELKGRLQNLEDLTGNTANMKDVITREMIKDCTNKPDQGLISVIQSAVTAEGFWIKSKEDRIKEEEAMQRQIRASLAEEKERAEKALNIRVGGLERQVIENMQKQNEGKEDLLATHLKERFNIKITGISKLYLQGPQVVVALRYKQDRIDILQQAYKLKGTKVWIAEDLTREQLSRKKEELQKVKQARAEGLWARYQNGEAVIRKFRETKNIQVKH